MATVEIVVVVGFLLLAAFLGANKSPLAVSQTPARQRGALDRTVSVIVLIVLVGICIGAMITAR